MINNNTYGYPSQYGSVYSKGVQTPSPLLSANAVTNSALSLPQSQTGFSYQNPQFDTSGATTPDLNTILQMLVAIITQLMQTIGGSGSGTTAAKDQTGAGDDTGMPGASASSGTKKGGGCHGKGK